MGPRRTQVATAVLVAAMLLGVSTGWTGRGQTAAADVGQPDPDPTESSPTETPTLQPGPVEPSPSPGLELSHQSVDFGEVVLGGQRAESVTVTSVGAGALPIDTVTLDGGDAFSVTNDGCSQQRLQPQSSCDVTVVFAPATEGEAGAQLVVASRATEGPRTVALAGAGRADGRVVVPDVEGSSLAEADDAVSTAGLRLDVVSGADQGDASVVRQDPPGGTRVAPGTRVTVEVQVEGGEEVVEVAAEESPDDAAVSWPSWLVASLLALIAAGLLVPLTQALRWLRRRRPRWVRQHVRFESRVSPPETSAHAVGQDTSRAVRVAVHHDPGSQTVHEVTP